MDIKLIKQNYNIVDVISRYISLKKQGPEMVGNCIFHDDYHASMKISETKQIFMTFLLSKDIIIPKQQIL